mgnify:CR=1 FL=1
MEKLSIAIQNFTRTQLLPLAIPIAVAALVIVGFGLLIGWQRVIDWCKGHALHIILGLIAIYLATDIVQSFVTSLSGGF